MKKETSYQNPSKSGTKQSKSITSSKRANQLQRNITMPSKAPQMPMNSITKQNYDVMHKKINITQIQPLEVKYVLKCIQGLFKNRFLYITTHKQGQIIGSGNAKQLGLTLQIQGVGLAPRHAKFKFNGVRKFYVKDYDSQTGTWMKVPKQGIQIKNNDCYIIGNFSIKFQLSNDLNQIEQVCSLYNADYLADILIYNKITNLQELFKANYQNFKEYPFNKQQIIQLKKICEDSKDQFNAQKENKIINMYYLNQQMGFSQQIGWRTKRIYPTIKQTLINQQNNQNFLAQITKGRLYPVSKVFSKILPDKNYQLNLHDQIKIGDLVFQLNRFNVGVGESIGFRQQMQDCYIFQEDIGGSEWKLISLFAVIDGYGGNECVTYIKENLVNKIRQWTKILDEAGDLNQMLRLLMSKTFYELDYQFYLKYPDIALSCGATIISNATSSIQGIIEGFYTEIRNYTNQVLTIYLQKQCTTQGRVDEKARIEQAGGFIQYNRLNGKCTLSRALGQFQYKDVNDYKNNMKGKLKSCLSCIPEVVCFDIQPANDQFILLSTDGIFDALNMKTIIDYILEKAANLQKEQNPNKIVNSLIQNCKITSPQCDNMAVILIFIKKGKIGSKHSF